MKTEKYLQKILCQIRKLESTWVNLMNLLLVIWDQDKKKRISKEEPSKKDQSSIKKK
jgi:hypothetical protein